MSERVDLESLERDAYRASWSDGIVDLYVGLSMVWIGACWIWLEDLAALAGIFPAIFVVPMMSARKRFLEARLGYARWRAPRRRWERRNLWLVLGAGVTLLVLSVLAFAVVSGQSDGAVGQLRLAPGIMAWLLALLAVGLAFLMDAPRMLAYSVMLAVTGGVAVWLQSTPGWPMLVTGIAAAIVGTVMLNRFTKRYPVVKDQ